MATKFVWFVRHGKSAWPPGVPDRERPLNSRGTEDGKRMGTVLAQVPNYPELWISSDSQRTRQTTELINHTIQARVQFEHRLYSANESDVTRLLQEVAPSIQSVGIVTHLPTLERCVSYCEREHLPPNLPTLVTVCTKFVGSWLDFDVSAIELVDVYRPKDYRKSPDI